MAITFLTNEDKTELLRLIEEANGGCITGTGAPTTATKGDVGDFYMDTSTGEVYKCTAVNEGVYTWADLSVADITEINARLDELSEAIDTLEEDVQSLRESLGVVESVSENMPLFLISGNVDIYSYTYTKASNSNWMGSICTGQSVNKGGILSIDFDEEYVDGANIDIRMYLFDENGNPYKHTGCAEEKSKTGGFAGELYSPTWWNLEDHGSNALAQSYGDLTASCTVEIPEGCHVMLDMRCTTYEKGAFTKGAEFAQWAMNGGIQCVLTTSPANELEVVREDVARLEEAIGDVVKTTPQTLTNEQKAQVRENIGVMSSDEVVFTEKNIFKEWVAGNQVTVSTDGVSYESYTGSNHTYIFFTTQSTIAGGRVYIDFDTNKIINLGVRGFLFDADNNLIGACCIDNGSKNPAFNYASDGSEISGDYGYDAWLEITDLCYRIYKVKSPFSVAVPEGCTTMWEIYLVKEQIVLPDGSLTWEGTTESLANNTYVYQWAKTNIAANTVVEKRNSTETVLYTPQTLTTAQKDQARKNIDAVHMDDVVAAIKSAGGMPEYWRNYLDSKLPDIRNAIASAGVASDGFLYFTDHHIGGMEIATNANNTKYIIDYIRKHTPIQRAIHGGDVLSTMTGQAHEHVVRWLWEFHDDYIAGRGVLPVVGNHESSTQYNTNGDKVTASEVYAALFKNAEQHVNTNGRFFYSFDNESQKVRYIVLDTESTSLATNTVQLQWFVDVLSKMESGWTAVLFSHNFADVDDYEHPTNPIITQIAGDYNNRSNGEGSGVSWDFTSASGTVACLICGHHHFDASGENNGILVINVTTDCGKNASQSSNDINAGGVRKAGDISEHAVDLFIINTEDRTIKTIRLGYGADRSWTY